MARNRKRAKERRARRPQAASVVAANAALDAQLDDSGAAHSGEAGRRAGGMPEPTEHAAPDVELAEAQLAAGRPELAPAGLAPEPVQVEVADEAEPLEPELEDESTAAPGTTVARPREGNRLINFARGSWAELQRVQWPDRRQVMQATSVVIGFVIVAGVFLGVSDFVAGKIMNFILK